VVYSEVAEEADRTEPGQYHKEAKVEVLTEEVVLEQVLVAL
jgi:hypothetical protein